MAVAAETLPNAGERMQPVLDRAVEALRRINRIASALASGTADKKLNALIDRGHRIDKEFVRRTRLDHIAPQHQVLNVGLWNEYALSAGEAAFLADIEEAFDFFVHSADRLHFSLLIDRAGHRKVLTQRKLGERR